jgi:hypothetical protein
VFTKLATAIVYLMVGLGLGYIVWGARVGSLTEALNHMVLEENSLRSRLSGMESEDDRSVLAGALDELAQQLREHSARIADQAAAIDAITADEGSALKTVLSDCTDRTSVLERDLEACLFQKASTERTKEANTPRAPTPTSGTAPVERTVTYPEPKTPPAAE